MQEQYRSDYDGEFVVTGVRIKNGKREQTREWVDNPLDIESLSGRAVCVSNGPSSDEFNLKMLAGRHGLLDSLALHNYTTGNLYEKFTPNFHITFNTDYLQDLVNKQLTEDIMVYTSGTQCLKTPGEFFIVPYGVKSTEEAVAAYLAAFDGHKEVYLVGYDEHDVDGNRRTKMIETMCLVFKAYAGVKFYSAVRFGKMPEEWEPYTNLNMMTVDEFRSKCDVSNGQWLRK
jgi:hypothetical protein